MKELNQNVLREYSLYLKKVKYPSILQDLKLEYNTDEECPFIYLGLIKIRKSQRHKGYGSQVMSDIIKLADDCQIEIRLYAADIYGTDLPVLYRFYHKHGFVLIKNNNDGNFIYRPKKMEKYCNILNEFSYKNIENVL